MVNMASQNGSQSTSQKTLSIQIWKTILFVLFLPLLSWFPSHSNINSRCATFYHVKKDECPQIFSSKILYKFIGNFDWLSLFVRGNILVSYFVMVYSSLKWGDSQRLRFKFFSCPPKFRIISNDTKHLNLLSLPRIFYFVEGRCGPILHLAW